MLALARLFAYNESIGKGNISPHKQLTNRYTDMHSIGIDFGTTKTLVSRIKTKTGEPETVRLGQGTDHIPTSVFITSSGEMCFGDAADDSIMDPNGFYLRGFKMQLGSSVPVHVMINDEGEFIQFSAFDIVTRFFSYIRKRVQDTVFAGQPITHATITRPVNFSPARCEELRKAAIAAGFESITLTTEPLAAGLAFCQLNDAEAFQHSALIVDWGGGTLDFSLVTRENGKIITHPYLTNGDMTMGGELFDQHLWNYAENALHTYGITDINPIAMLPVVRKCKEKLSSVTESTLRLTDNQGSCPPIHLTQELFFQLINNSVEKAAEKIKELLTQIPLDKKPEILLLVGGSCRIPFIKTKLEEICGLPAKSWHLSREAVALGAALWEQHSSTSSKPRTSPNISSHQISQELSQKDDYLLPRDKPKSKLVPLLLLIIIGACIFVPIYYWDLHEKIDIPLLNRSDKQICPTEETTLSSPKNTETTDRSTMDDTATIHSSVDDTIKKESEETADIPLPITQKKDETTAVPQKSENPSAPAISEQKKIKKNKVHKDNRVTFVNNDYGFIHISIGNTSSRKQIRKGSQLYVMRNDKFVCILIVSQVTENEAIAYIQNGTLELGEQVKVGDKVIEKNNKQNSSRKKKIKGTYEGRRVK